MPYTVPSVDQFHTRFPIFADSDDDLIAVMIAEASRSVDTTWEEGDYQPAIMYLAAHLLATDNSGEGETVNVGAAGGDGAIVSESFQGLGSVSYASRTIAPGSLSASDQYGTTEYGRRYKALLKRNRGGPLVTC